MNEVNKLVQSIFDYLIRLRTDSKGWASTPKLDDTAVTLLIKNSSTIVFPQACPSLFRLLLGRDKTATGFKKFLEKQFNLNLLRIEDAQKTLLTVVLLCGGIKEVHGEHERWAINDFSLKITNEMVTKAVKYLDILDNLDRLHLLVLTSSEGEKIEEVLEKEQEAERKKVYGCACTLHDLLVSSGVMTVPHLTFKIEVRRVLTRKKHPWQRARGGSLPVQATAITSIASKIIDIISAENFTYIYKLASELAEVPISVRRAVESCRGQGKPLDSVVLDIERKLDKLIEISSYFDRKFFTRLERDIIETAVSGHYLGLWNLDFSLLLNYYTIRLEHVRRYDSKKFNFA